MLKIIKKDKKSGKSAILEINEEGKEILVKAGMEEQEAEKELEELDDEGAIYAKDG